MQAGCLYLVRFWARPDAEAEILAWLDGGHIAEVLRQPGFLWARRAALEEVDALGWRAHAMVYGLVSRPALEAYFANPIREKFAREGAAFAGRMRAERAWGPIAFAAGTEP